ncbi:hypothetical protein NC652_010950 [Populus alba x Populus x berolinensis]|uniref:Uncharacterized protein n=1 Tax=Populus alba x Populus x berolinensis TaxID=444605 RepID=A0AAD6W5U2_9ROSI|nr:hypothetical protein NC652_010950 [Populus alba x Populus x berolinensis]KAJ6999233.1 hypothetical protein NC653_010038 [Populus alba x Populus x berolinensis]KAJ7000395.1 hypothetical protein NC653_011010 [Populus alba x Populus x berolinensis]KAJ7000400.1 hypothetical protein NC653_011015 [Populus alba x Populus x berolinensis]
MCIDFDIDCQKSAARFEASLVFSVPSLQEGNLKAVEDLELERKTNIFERFKSCSMFQKLIAIEELSHDMNLHV